MQDSRKVEEQHAKRDRHFWVDGVIGGKSNQLAHLVAQVLANITAYFRPDPDNPPMVKGFLAEIKTWMTYPSRRREEVRGYRNHQPLHLMVMIKRLIRQGKLEESIGKYSSGLVLVLYHDSINSFTDKWGAAVQTEL